jgi:hypothetical protein
LAPLPKRRSLVLLLTLSRSTRRSALSGALADDDEPATLLTSDAERDERDVDEVEDLPPAPPPPPPPSAFDISITVSSLSIIPSFSPLGLPSDDRPSPSPTLLVFEL